MKKERILREILLTLVVLIIPFGLLAQTTIDSGKCGNNVFWNLTTEDEDSYTLNIYGTGAMTDFSSRTPWYQYFSKIKSIVIENGVTHIGNSAFENIDYSAITNVTIPGSVESIGVCAFNACKGLTSIRIPSSVKSIGSCAFYRCYNLQSVEIPYSVTEIEHAAFAKCQKLTSIKVHENNPIYNSRDDCNAIIETATNTLLIGCKNTKIPDGVTSLSSVAFAECVGLTSIEIPNSVVSINDGAFGNCSKLKDVYVGCHWEKNPLYQFGEGVTVQTIYHNYEDDKCSICGHLNTEVDKIVLLDGENYKVDENKQMDEITYTRTLNNTAWNALYVPFEIPVSQLIDDYEVAYINGIHSYDDDDNGEIDRMSMEVVKVKSGTIHANHPYLIKARTEEAKEMSIAVNNSTLYKAESTTLDCSSVYMKYEITGIYEQMTGSELSGCYALSGGAWKTISSDSYLNSTFASNNDGDNREIIGR